MGPFDVIVIGGGVVGSAMQESLRSIVCTLAYWKKIWMSVMRPAAEIPAWSMADLPMTQAH